jgi:class 3 adenylate cyclase/tetratricopeptide (TPR) repeat protein
VGDGREDIAAYLPASLVRAVAASGPREVPWCEEVEGTMVMADLSGFTPLSEGLARLGDEGAERLTAVINGFFAALLSTASRYGGDTLTFGGDAILLLFAGDGHAVRAVAAALDMLQQTARMAAVHTGAGKVKLGMSVGAHSGRFPLMAAGLGKDRLHLFVPGRGAELTATAEARAGRGQLAVTSSTKALLEASGSAVRLVQDGEDSGFWVVNATGKRSLDVPVSEQQVIGPEVLESLTPFLPPYARGGGEEAVSADQGRLTPEHRRVATVFVDVLGLTDVIERDGLDAGVAELQRYAELLLGLAAKHRGFLVSTDIATEGTKALLTFGAPVAHEYAALNAARFALDLDAGLGAAGLKLRQRIGVSGGHVFAGEVGPESRRQYTVMGDAVNLAARLMAVSSPGQVLTSKELAEAIGAAVSTEELPPLTVKGKAHPVAVCALRGQRRPTTRNAAVDCFSSAKLFGRAAESDFLQSRLTAVRSGRGCAVLIEGEAGIGKTRLLEDIVRTASHRARVTWVACFEHLQASPFTPWVDALEAVVGISRSQSVLARTHAVAGFLQARLPDWLELGPLLNPLLGLTLHQTEVVGSLDARTRRQRLFELVGEILVTAAPDGVHILVVEDVHWMDESSSALLRKLAARLDTAAVLLLLTARPFGAGEDLAASGITRLELAELDEHESLAMVRDALSAGATEAEGAVGVQLPREVEEAIYAKTKGNPLFLEEVVRALLVPGVLDRLLASSSLGRAAELATLAIPDRVQGLLMSRIDALTRPTGDVLKAAAVVGRTFDIKVLAGVGDDLVRRGDLAPALEELSGAALVLRGGAESGGMTFRHALVQDVAYESVPFARRRVLHERVAKYLEMTHAAPDHGVLVYHYARAGDRLATRLHAVRAAEASVAVYANREAADYLDVGLDTVHGRSPAEAAIRSRLEELSADALETLARHDEAIDRYVRARRRWRSQAVREAADTALEGLSPIDDPATRESLLCWKIAVSVERGLAAYRRALRWLDMGTRALPPRAAVLPARIKVTKSAVLSRMGRCKEALVMAEEGVRLAERCDDVALQAYASAMEANALFGLGMLERAIGADTRATRLYEEAGDLAGRALSHGNLASNYQLSGDFRAAFEHNELSLALYRRLGFTTGVVVEQSNLGELLLQMGDTDEALVHLQEAVKLRGADGVPPSLTGFALILLSRALLRTDDLVGAEAALTEGRDLLRSIDAKGLLLDAAVQEAELHLARGDAEATARVCSDLRAEAACMGAQLSEAQALALLGRVGLRRGESVEALEYLSASVRLAQEAGADYDRARALTALAEAEAGCGDAACSATLDEAVALLEQMGARYDLACALALRERLLLASG